MLHSHTGIVWGRVVWCNSCGLLHIKRREFEAEIRYFAENLVALWQSNVSCCVKNCVERRICCWCMIIVWVRECKRQLLTEESVVVWRIVCREWRHWIRVFVENGWLICDFGVGDFGVVWRRISGDWLIESGTIVAVDRKFWQIHFYYEKEINYGQNGDFLLRIWFHYGNQIKAGHLLSPGEGLRRLKIEGTRKLKLKTHFHYG